MPHHPVACPVCGQTMQKQNIPQGIEVDHCATHGVWLDHGELEALLRIAQPTATAHHAPPHEPSSGVGAAVKQVGQQFGQSVVMGAGATLGNRIIGGIIDSVFGR
jgi:Zn-finger nucleic acid-binding protein